MLDRVWSDGILPRAENGTIGFTWPVLGADRGFAAGPCCRKSSHPLSLLKRWSVQWRVAAAKATCTNIIKDSSKDEDNSSDNDNNKDKDDAKDDAKGN